MPGSVGVGVCISENVDVLSTVDVSDSSDDGEGFVAVGLSVSEGVRISVRLGLASSVIVVDCDD